MLMVFLSAEMINEEKLLLDLNVSATLTLLKGFPLNTGKNGTINASEIMNLLDCLTNNQQTDLYRQLGVADEEELYVLLGIHNSDDGSYYDKKLMSFETYRMNKMLLYYIPPIIIVCGTFGNMFSVAVLRSKAMQKFSTYLFLMIMAITDTLVLYVGLLPLWVSQMTGHDIRNRSNFACKVSNTVGSMVSDFSVWLIVAVSVERYTVVCHPFSAGSLCSADRAKKLATVLMAVFFLLNSHFLWTVEIVYYSLDRARIPECSISYRIIKAVWPWVDALVYSIVPFFVIILFNTLIIRHVMIARGKRDSLQNRYQQRRPSQEGSTRLTLMLLTVSFTFLLTTLPMTIVSICAQFGNPKPDELARVANFKLMRTTTELLMYANHSINFFLYCATGQKFRHQLAWIICYNRRTTALTQGPLKSDQMSVSKIGSVRTGVYRPSRGSRRKEILALNMFVARNVNNKQTPTASPELRVTVTSTL